MLSRVSLCAALVLGTLAPAALAPAVAQELPATPRRATLSVTGEGVARATPDMASFSTAVVSEAKTAREALDANSQSVAAMIAAIKASGVEERDIATSGFSVQPRYAPPRKDSTEAPPVVGYEVRNAVDVRVRDLGKLGGLLDALVTSGANQIGGIAFDIADPSALEDQARVAAMRDARHQADIIAEAGGLRVVRLVAISTSGTIDPPMPRMMAAPAMMKAEAVPVQAGESEVRARVSVVFEVEPR